MRIQQAKQQYTLDIGDPIPSCKPTENPTPSPHEGPNKDPVSYYPKGPIRAEVFSAFVKLSFLQLTKAQKQHSSPTLVHFDKMDYNYTTWPFLFAITIWTLWLACNAKIH